MRRFLGPLLLALQVALVPMVLYARPLRERIVYTLLFVAWMWWSERAVRRAAARRGVK